MHALLHVLDHQDPILDEPGLFVSDVEPLTAEPYRVELPYASEPDLVAGVVLGYPVPGLVDLDNPRDVVLLEPPGGVDLPLVETDLAEARSQRDARTLELLHRFPSPTVAQLRALFGDDPSPTAASSPLFPAARFRLHLLTTPEATDLLAAIDDSGDTWHEANDLLRRHRPGWDSAVYTEAAATVSHLSGVAPGGSRLDEQPLMDLLLALRAKDEAPGTVDELAFVTALHPWIQVLGPLEG
jgi:hypothetical protein